MDCKWICVNKCVLEARCLIEGIEWASYLKDGEEGSYEGFKPRTTGGWLEPAPKELGSQHGKDGNEENKENEEGDDGGHGVKEGLD